MCSTRAVQTGAIYRPYWKVSCSQILSKQLFPKTGEPQLNGFIFATNFARYHCITLITVSPHSKLLVFLQTAHITPRNLIIGTHYVFRALNVNIGNLWHAPPHRAFFSPRASLIGFHRIEMVYILKQWNGFLFWPIETLRKSLSDLFWSCVRKLLSVLSILF